ncbi:MAG: 50S ribosomal protein L2 [Candidatus Jorgensenbacteria bacterium GW2011_GWB1_50_10]|uniref:Large ribosomal subunit protein uL2 n=1 Tax=Candidatus Jorgensenbacteria bacterium GW2011_GWB1_50_10 TaxID=1618665 RepID=A0A0G1W8I0_9BACT|nr:MAG: 50S ribosomal protein L2 [Candidatus Jorgensenbacteria bacterium GW2011_GWB1_50_10]
MKSYKPTTPSRRFITVPDYRSLAKTGPLKSLTRAVLKKAGRNSSGRITMRHQGGGVKSIYRLVDFKENKVNVPGRVEAIEYDPYRTAFIARVIYKDGERRYILASDGLKVGTTIVNSEDAPFEVGNRTSLKRIPVGTFVHNVEILPGKGGQLGRAAGSSIQILANEEGYTHLKMSSGEVRKVPWGALASIGQVSNPEHNLIVVGNAGRSRKMGIRPTVRASVMNPRDHKYGGGEGRTQRGTRRPKDKWGNITGGRKTRKKKKWSNKMILKRRK